MDVLAFNWDYEVSCIPMKSDWVSLTMRRYNAVAFYLDIADMLAKEGL